MNIKGLSPTPHVVGWLTANTKVIQKIDSGFENNAIGHMTFAGG